jgi:lipoyl(octanoyl) transferase
MAARSFVAHALGRMAYAEAHSLQERLLDARIRGSIGDTVLLLEHEPVITLGRSGRQANVLASREQLSADGILVHETARGGDVTFHGPGQLVAYPIFDLRPDRCDVRRYVRDLARVMISLSARHGIAASFWEGDPALVGVWVDEDSPTHWRGDPRVDGGATRPAKIGAIGVRISRWVTMHGFAYNLRPDLSAFRLIVPCGLARYGVTSVRALGGRQVTLEAATEEAVSCFEAVFEATGTLASQAETKAMREGLTQSSEK